MLAKLHIGSLCERDIDRLVLEEVAANPRFLAWLLAQIPDWPDDLGTLTEAAVSVDHADGESDLVLSLAGAAGRTGKLFIENKIGAGFQPRQIERYRERASQCVQGACVRAAVVLLAPDIYPNADEIDVDAFIPYEDIRAQLASATPDARLAFKLRLLDLAIEKAGKGYNPETDHAVTDFWGCYHREALRHAPELCLEPPGPRPAGAGFIWFRRAGLPAGITLCHKLPHGCVDLQFANWGDRLGKLRERLKTLLEPDMEIVRASKSAAVRLRVPVLHTDRTFADQSTAALQGIATAARLLDWARRQREDLARV